MSSKILSPVSDRQMSIEGITSTESESFLPGTLVIPSGNFASIWRVHDDTEYEPLPVERTAEGERALVISSDDKMAFVLFKGVFGYVYNYRLSPVF